MHLPKTVGEERDQQRKKRKSFLSSGRQMIYENKKEEVKQKLSSYIEIINRPHFFHSRFNIICMDNLTVMWLTYCIIGSKLI